MSDTPSAAQSKASLSVLKELLRFLAPYRWRVVGAAIALLFTAGATLSLGTGVQVLIDEGFSSGGNTTQLKQALLGLVVIGSAIAGGVFVRFYLVSWLGERVSADLRVAVFNNVVHLHPGYFEDNRSGEIISRLTADTSVLQTIIGSSFSLALRSSITLSGALVMMMITNLKLSLIILVGVPLVLAPILIFGRRVRRLSNRSQDSIANVGSYAGEIIQHIRTVQSYTRESDERAAFSGEVEKAFTIARSRVRQRALLASVAMLLLFGALVGMLWEGGSDVINGVLTPGELGAFVFYAMLVGSGFATLSEVWGDLQRAAGATERLLDLLQTESAIVEPPVTTAPVLARRPELKLANVGFCYPSRPNDPALDDLSLLIEPGKSLALVGPSGAGKSTVFELLQRFYDPQQGSILLDGTDLRHMSTQELRSQMALVPQAPAMFTADVSYNIAYGRPDATEEQIRAAAQAAYADEFIVQLPQGYKSHLGEQGVRLSGGQKQRIALARAILNDPAILLLDEATSALDAESEHKVQMALQKLMLGRTTVIIAHRLSTILHADRIAVLEGGKVIATGTHESLLESSPLYARLARLQFREPEAAESSA